MAGPETRRRISIRVDSKGERDIAVRILKNFDSDVHIYDGLVTGWADRDVILALREHRLLIYESSTQKSEPAPSLPQTQSIPTAVETASFAQLLQELQELQDKTALVKDRAPAVAITKPRRFVAGAVDTLSAALLTTASEVVNLSGGRLAPAMNSVIRWTIEAAAGMTFLPITTPDATMYEVQLLGPMRPEWAARLKECGAEIASYVPPFRYRIPLTEAQLAKVNELDFVHSTERYSLKATLGPGFLLQLQRTSKTEEITPTAFDLTVHFQDQIPAICRLLERQKNVKILEAFAKGIRFQALINDPFLIALADREEVKALDIYTPPTLLLQYCRELIGVAAINSNASSHWDGSGEVVGMLDSGVDKTHPDLSDRIKSYQQVSGATDTDVSGHGTHVAGVIAGTGKASKGQTKGVAPGAQLTVIGIVNANDSLIFPTDLSEFLLRATAGGAKIINLSLGKRNTNGLYDRSAESLDTFVYNNPEVLVVVAAGNDGTATSGYPDYQSVNSPATANNVIAVGACSTTRPGIANTWEDFNQGRFPAPPVGALAMAGGPVEPAGLSSRGPSENRTIKPDVLAPGTFVLSAAATGGKMQSYAPVPPDAGPYIFLNGTSMAAPFVSGVAAILRQYLNEILKIKNPSAALLKAMLCASAVRCQQLVNPQITPWFGYPDFDQGFGLVNLSRLIPHKDGGKLRMAFADVPNNSADALASRQPDNAERRSSRNYRLTLGENSGPLQVVLSWTDAPGPYVKNVLFLDVKGPNVALVGNHQHAYSRIGHFNDTGLNHVPYDRQNNTQIVYVEKPVPGEYFVNVFAYNTFDPDKTQGYALCVCGDLASDLQPVQPLF
jgi:serine protease AprX